MAEKTNNKGVTGFEEAWDEVRLCARLVREKKARIVIVTRRDGSRFRYTKIR